MSRWMRIVVGLCAVAVVFAVAVPHVHAIPPSY